MPLCILGSGGPPKRKATVLHDRLVRSKIGSISFGRGVEIVGVFSVGVVGASNFLHYMFRVFDRDGISISLVDASRTGVSMAISVKRGVSEIIRRLSRFYSIVISSSGSRISIVKGGVIELGNVLGGAFTPLGGYGMCVVSRKTSFIGVDFIISERRIVSIIGSLRCRLFRMRRRLRRFW